MVGVRRARPDDFDQIWPMLRATFRSGTTYAVDPHISKAAARSYWMDQPAATFVAEQTGVIVGTYYIKPNQPGGGAHICNCGYVVSESARGQGFARLMCEASQVQAAQMGFTAMQFNFVLASNVGAVRLWHKLGFVTLGTIPDAFDHPELGMVDAYVMHKHL